MTRRTSRRSRHRRHKRDCAYRGLRRRLGLPERGDLSIVDLALADWQRIDSTHRPLADGVVSILAQRNPWLDGVSFVPAPEGQHRYEIQHPAPVWGGAR